MDLQEAFLVQTCASCDGVDGRQQAEQGFASRRQQADQTIRLCARISLWEDLEFEVHVA